MWWQTPAPYVEGALGIAAALAVAALAVWLRWRQLRRWPWPQQPRAALGVLMAMAGVAAGFVAVIGGGFRWHGGTAPAGLDRAFWPAVAVLAGVVGWFAAVQVPQWRARAARGRVASRQDREAQAWAAERRAWLDRLDADPATRPYAERLRAGEHWTQEGVDYDRDPTARALCVHLRPLEDDLRRAVPGLRRLHGASLQVPCRLDRAALQRRVPLPDGVRYEEPVYRDRQGDDERGALLRCTQCGGTVAFVHDDVARPGTPAYPPGPGADARP